MKIKSLRNTSEWQRRWSQKDERWRRKKRKQEEGGKEETEDKRRKAKKRRKTENDQAVCLK